MMPSSEYLSIYDPQDVEVATKCGQAVTAAIYAGDREAACDAIRQAFAVLETFNQINVDSPIEKVLTAQPKIVEILHSGGIFTIGQLVDETRETIVSRYGLRYRSVWIIEAQLRKHNFSLRRSETLTGDTR